MRYVEVRKNSLVQVYRNPDVWVIDWSCFDHSEIDLWVRDLQQRNIALDSENGDLQKQLETAKAKIKAQQNEMDHLNGEIDRLNLENIELDKAAAEAEYSNETLKNQLRQLDEDKETYGFSIPY